ncbi:MAG: hypothetical protein ACTSSA_05665 [Candidatus Freyarchaeota archaeon]|nr:hypothetical protein [Candidatus Freyarchaeota archaeon]
MSDDFSELLEFADDKKIKELAEIISGVAKIMLNAIDMLEGRMNELDNRLSSLERYVDNKIEEVQHIASTSPETRERPRRGAPMDREREAYAPRPVAREPASFSRPTPAPAYGASGGTATARGPSGQGAGSSPMSARMQLQSELKDLFSRMRARRG